jgi:peptidoglycan-N-acetylglucosamine deacetylase
VSTTIRLCGAVLVMALAIGHAAAALEPIPDKLVVLTFDDSKASHYTVVRPLLKKYGFGATFFITEGFTFRTNKDEYLTWEQIAELHRDGFEIGNHTRDHMGLTKANLPKLKEQVDAISAKCAAHGIPTPTSFAYPGNTIDPDALRMLADLGFRFARRGGAPEYPYEEGNGFAYEPGRDHPLLLPSAGDARPAWALANLERAVSQAVKRRIAILQFHGIPDVEHPWVHTPPERFEEYMKYLHDNGFKVIALRDLAKYVDWTERPADPWRVIDERKAALKQGGDAE